MGRHGCLADVRGEPFRLTGRPELLARLLADAPEAARLAGARTPAGFAAAARRSAELRERVRAWWRDAGRALAPSGPLPPVPGADAGP